jgi:hypothetical protein
MNFRLTSQDIWLSTLFFFGLDLFLLIPLALAFRNQVFQGAMQPIGLSAFIFWGLLVLVAMLGFWDLYYRYFYPAWARWLIPLDGLLYSAMGLGMWWVSRKLSPNFVLGFALLGGLEGIVEHLLGIFAFRILEKVPWLQGIAPLPVLIFSFFEYVAYWSLVGWLGYGLSRLS